MSEIAAIGAHEDVVGFALAGARIYPVSSAEQARTAWRQLPASVAVVIITDLASEAIGDARTDSAAPLTVRLPA